MDKVLAILHRRTLLSAIYTIILQSVLVIIFSFSNIDIFHPIVWISKSFVKLTSFSVLVFYVILCSLLAALCGVFKTKILCGPYVLKSRLDKLQRIISFNTLFQMCLHILIGVITSCLYLSVIGGKYSSLLKPCTLSSGYCASEEKVFLMYSGACGGIYVFLCNFFESCAIHFPVIQQISFLRLKAELLPSVKQSMKDALLPCISYPFLHILNGSMVLHFLCDVFNLTVEEKVFGNIFDYVKLSLLFYAWLQTSLLIFSVVIMKHIMNIALTDLPEFPITCRFGQMDTGTLHEVIGASKYPVIQNWGCLDLLCVAKNDEIRRKEIFALSQPGGHPNNWNSIRKECLQVIDSFVENINLAVSEMVTCQPEKTEVFSAPVPSQVRFTQEMSPGMRNLTIVDQDVSFHCEAFSEEPFIIWHQLFGFFVSFLRGIISPVLKKTGLNNVFDKYPEAQIKCVLSNSLPVINAVQGLSFLIAASLTEDEFGVVRKDLNTILIAIQQLKLTVDRALKLWNFKRIHKNDNEMQIKVALKSALKRSLYKICITFRNHMKDLDLPQSVYNNFQVYLTFKE